LLVGFGAARLVRFGVPFELLPDGAVVAGGFGGNTTTGSSGVVPCAASRAATGSVVVDSETARLRGNAGPNSRRCHDEVR
jgi:hypothetical protein